MVSLTSSNRDAILTIARKHGAGHVRVFGSYARGEEKDSSDLDLLVDVACKPGPWFPAGLAVELEDLLGIPVDIVTEAGLHPAFKDSILQGARDL